MRRIFRTIKPPSKNTATNHTTGFIFKAMSVIHHLADRLLLRRNTIRYSRSQLARFGKNLRSRKLHATARFRMSTIVLSILLFVESASLVNVKLKVSRPFLLVKTAILRAHKPRVEIRIVPIRFLDVKHVDRHKHPFPDLANIPSPYQPPVCIRGASARDSQASVHVPTPDVVPTIHVLDQA